jgi:hypothetical protein
MLKKMDGRFEFRNCVRFAGPSMCGKTVTLCKLLANKKYFKPNAPKRVMWVSGSDTVDEKIEELIKSHYPDSQFFYGAPNCQKLRTMVRKHDAWVFDDLAGELSTDREFSAFFTKTAHHKECIMFYLSQNPFEKSKESVTRTRNCAYQVFFNNNADVRWVAHVGHQLLGNAQLFEEMFQSVMIGSYDCLLCDNRATTRKEDGQFIGHPFNPTEENPTCYLIPYK